MDMKLPFSTTGMMLHLDDSMDYEVLSSSIESMPKSDKTEDEIVLEAMEHPIGSPKLSELAKGKDILIVGHGAMNSSIICQVRGRSYAHLWDEGIENCKLKRLI